MNNLSRPAIKLIGALSLILGVTALVFVGYAVVFGVRELLLTPEALALHFLFSLGLLLACSGIPFVFQRNALTRRSLVPSWDLVAGGARLVLAVAGLAYFGGGKPKTD